jgi:hypothetical protein
MRVYKIVGALLVLSLLSAGPLWAQAAGQARAARQPRAASATPSAQQEPIPGQVLMLEEIHIAISPELPTVVVSIPRQKPEINSVILMKDPEDLIMSGTAQVKPRLTDLQVNQIEDPQKLLAKERSQ